MSKQIQNIPVFGIFKLLEAGMLKQLNISAYQYAYEHANQCLKDVDLGIVGNVFHTLVRHLNRECCNTDNGISDILHVIASISDDMLLNQFDNMTTKSILPSVLHNKDVLIKVDELIHYTRMRVSEEIGEIATSINDLMEDTKQHDTSNDIDESEHYNAVMTAIQYLYDISNMFAPFDNDHPVVSNVILLMLRALYKQPVMNWHYHIHKRYPVFEIDTEMLSHDLCSINLSSYTIGNVETDCITGLQGPGELVMCVLHNDNIKPVHGISKISITEMFRILHSEVDRVSLTPAVSYYMDHIINTCNIIPSNVHSAGASDSEILKHSMVEYSIDSADGVRSAVVDIILNKLIINMINLYGDINNSVHNIGTVYSSLIELLTITNEYENMENTPEKILDYSKWCSVDMRGKLSGLEDNLNRCMLAVVNAVDPTILRSVVTQLSKYMKLTHGIVTKELVYEQKDGTYISHDPTDIVLEFGYFKDDNTGINFTTKLGLVPSRYANNGGSIKAFVLAKLCSDRGVP